MPDQDLGADLQAFLRDHVESYEQLEVLLQMRTAGTVTAASLAAKLPLALGDVEEALARLAASGVIAREHPAEAGWQLRPDVPALRARVDALALAYDHKRLAVIRAMNANALSRLRNSALRTFADAFVVGRRKEGD